MLDTLRKYVSRSMALNDHEFALLVQMLEIRNFDKKQQLVKVGEVEHYLNFIVKGLARKFFYKGKRVEVITQIAKENELISSSVSFLSGAPSTYITETIEPCTFLSISKPNLEKLYKTSSKMERMGRLVITNLFLQKEYWDYDRIRLNTRERFINFIQDNPDMLQRVPQKYLASYLNIKPETFSRLKHLLQKKKVVNP